MRQVYITIQEGVDHAGIMQMYKTSRVKYAFLTGAEETNIDKVYQLFDDDTLSDISLVLKVPASANGKTAATLRSFFFLPQYGRKSSPNAIYLLPEGSQDIDKLKADINKEISGQGMSIPVVMIEENDIVTSVTDDQLHTEGSPLFLLYSELANIPAIVNTSHTVSKTMAEENEYLRKKVSLLEAELKMQHDFTEKLRSDHEAKSIQDHYDKEYEALPLWYKKIGSLIKKTRGKK